MERNDLIEGAYEIDAANLINQGALISKLGSKLGLFRNDEEEVIEMLDSHDYIIVIDDVSKILKLDKNSLFNFLQKISESIDKS